jgi:hypothetical protein
LNIVASISRMADAAFDQELVAALPKLRRFAFGLAGSISMRETISSRPPARGRWRGGTSTSLARGW